jgi:hypothetical protein
MKISICLPSVRWDSVQINYQSLLKQTFPQRDFEVLICAPFNRFEFTNVRWLDNPSKNPGDYYSLMKSWNRLFSNAKGELFVTVCDNEWIDREALERLWNRYEENPRALVSGIGNHYRDVLSDGIGIDLVAPDVRPSQMLKRFQMSSVANCDQALCSIPRRAVYDVGGVEEEFDKVASNGEQEMLERMIQAGYTTWVDQDVKYVAKYHERLNVDWNRKFAEGRELYFKYKPSILAGDRLKLEYI